MSRPGKPSPGHHYPAPPVGRSGGTGRFSPRGPGAGDQDKAFVLVIPAFKPSNPLPRFSFPQSCPHFRASAIRPVAAGVSAGRSIALTDEVHQRKLQHREPLIRLAWSVVWACWKRVMASV